MRPELTTRQVRDGIWQITDMDKNRAYLVCGQERAVLVDTMEGIGDLRGCVAGLTDLPVTVALTHHHHDHVGGAYQWDEVLMSATDDGFWEAEAADHRVVLPQLQERFGLDATDACPGCYPVVQGSRPAVRHVAEGDVLDLGGRRIEVVELPGHTLGSVGYLVQPDGLLLSGDAVTPVMTLFYADSTDIDGWEATLRKMQGLDFGTFMTGHHDREFARGDLASWVELAEFSKMDRGMHWVNDSLSYLRGQLHVMSPLDMDPDSEDFRGLIEREKPREHHGRRRRRSAEE